VRRAIAIQMILDKEYGLYKNENMLQGSFIIEELTDLVEEAILREFESLSERGGVLGAMERGYQRGKIQEESLTTTSRSSTMAGCRSWASTPTSARRTPARSARPN
jgi:isobutyryl-CoA mutase